LLRQEDQLAPIPGATLEVCPARPPSDPGADGAEAELWRDVHGTVCAKSSFHDGFAWIEVPGVGVFRLNSGSAKCLAFPEFNVSREAVADAHTRIALPIGLSYCGYESLHASAVLTDGGVVGFCASSGTGKSTLAAAFCRAGYVAFADDALTLAIGEESPQIAAVCLPFSLRLLEGSPLLHSRIIRETVGARRPLAALFLLERRPLANGTPKAVRLRPGDALAGLLPHAYRLSLGGDSQRRQMILGRYLDVVSRVPVYKLCFASDLPSLPRLVQVVEEVLETSCVGQFARP
jgi:hypothetical protein